MKGRYAIPALAILATLGFASFQAARLLPRVRLEARESIHDFGNVSTNQDLEYSFHLAKSGFGSLRITEVITSCGCVDAKLKEGHRGWDLDMKMRSEQEVGPKRIVAYVRTDEPTDNQYQFELRCNVTSPVRIDPLPIDLGMVDLESASSARVDFRIAVEEGLGEPLISVVDPLDPPSLRLVKGADGMHSLVFNQSVPVGPLTAFLSVQFSKTRLAGQSFAVRGMVSGDPFAAPAEIESIWHDRDKAYVGRVRLMTELEEPGRSFAVDRCFGDLGDPRDSTVTIIREVDSTFLELRLEPGGRWLGTKKCKAIIRLSCGPKRAIVIPVNIN